MNMPYTISIHVCIDLFGATYPEPEGQHLDMFVTHTFIDALPLGCQG